MINSSKLKGRMRELDLTQKDIASALSITPSTVSLKLSGSRPITLDEAETIAKTLRIEDSQFSVYFFSQ